MHSVSGRHYDDRSRNATDVFRKAYTAFYYIRSLPSTHGNCRSEYRHRTKCFEVHYTPVTLIRVKLVIDFLDKQVVAGYRWLHGQTWLFMSSKTFRYITTSEKWKNEKKYTYRRVLSWLLNVALYIYSNTESSYVVAFCNTIVLHKAVIFFKSVLFIFESPVFREVLL